jgi:hypothetical protein
MVMMKLSEVLFETAEEYYRYNARVSGRLNRVETLDGFSRYKRVGVNFVEYDPDLFAADDESPDATGGLTKVSSPGYSKQRVVLDLRRNIVYLTRSALPEHDPLTLFQLKELVSVVPEVGGYEVVRVDRHGNEVPYGKTLGEFMSVGREISPTSSSPFPASMSVISKQGVYPRYKKGEELFDEFRFEVLKDLGEVLWYHATKVSNYEKIRHEGLKPSKAFSMDDQQQHGWTMFNFDLQNAVYLTHDIERARDIASALTERHLEDAVVLRVSGEALGDVRRLVVDEDELRDSYTDEIVPREAQGIPEYVISVTSQKIAGLGYKGVIPPEYIEVAEVVRFELPSEEDE